MGNNPVCLVLVLQDDGAQLPPLSRPPRGLSERLRAWPRRTTPSGPVLFFALQNLGFMATSDDDEDARLWAEAVEMVAEATQIEEVNAALSDMYEALRVIYLEGASVKQMCDATGVARTTVYEYVLLACPASIFSTHPLNAA